MDEKIILIVEDNADDKELILRAFRKCSIKAKPIIAHDGVEALDYMHCTGVFADKDEYEMPSLIILDLKLPKVDGKEVLTAIRAHAKYRYIPVVILSSSSEKNDVNECFLLGANSYIKKPIDFRAFMEIVALLVKYWLDYNELPRL
jgi:two-component system response regulator